MYSPAERASPHSFEPEKADGFLGVWYGYTDGTYYAGGLGTFPQQIHPMAYYAPKAGHHGRTFFVFGGVRRQAPEHLLTCISFYDHATGTVARPRVLNDRGTNDGHDNPSLMLDGQGYIHVFSNAHGLLRESFIYRSVQPYSIEKFILALRLPTSTNFSYAQPWWIEDRGMFLFHSLYGQSDPIRRLYFNTSADGMRWDYDWDTRSRNARPAIALIPGGCYQVSMSDSTRIGTMFNYNVDAVGRTNLYYLETVDMGKTWKNAQGDRVAIPVVSPDNDALVYNYQAEQRFVFLKELHFDAKGNPVLLYLTSPTEENDTTTPRRWHTARFDRANLRWMIRDAFVSDNNYDHGTLFIEPDRTWRVIAPTDPGPQPGRTGGDMVMWSSGDEGASWQRIKQLTWGGTCNHTYARQPVGAHDGFCAFWADGDATRPSGSSLYFTDRLGGHIWRLPRSMSGEYAEPEVAFTPGSG